MWRPPWPTPWALEAALSSSTVSRVCQAIKDEYDAWGHLILGEVELDYLL